MTTNKGNFCLTRAKVCLLLPAVSRSLSLKFPAASGSSLNTSSIQRCSLSQQCRAFCQEQSAGFLETVLEFGSVRISRKVKCQELCVDQYVWSGGVCLCGFPPQRNTKHHYYRRAYAFGSVCVYVCRRSDFGLHPPRPSKSTFKYIG